MNKNAIATMYFSSLDSYHKFRHLIYTCLIQYSSQFLWTTPRKKMGHLIKYGLIKVLEKLSRIMIGQCS